jgi:ADP-ribosylglycohydrolase/fructose-1,6-bisphosphatase/inositol monophosphatase family enzyme
MAPDLAHMLEVAVSAARDAGDRIRAEFERVGGPRGHGGHAPVDIEAEEAIRARLLAAFPGTGFRGEETGSVSADPDDPAIWVVDPNDGTVSFLRGMRGSAVSIALVRRGLPVLGVVFAPTAPDGDGDLFAWAEGCGPLRRNGAPVERSPFPTALAPTDVVIVSQAGDKASAENAAAVAPARFLALPSIAYRLARVAAGDAVAAVSLNSPGDWDYAAGHALLRAVGGDLLDERGEPVRYGPAGTSHTRWCFGGGEAVCRELARRDWTAVLRAPKAPRDLVSLEPGRCVRDPGLLSRAQGCLLGLVAGDSLGSRVEFQSAAGIAAAHPEGVLDLADGGTWHLLAGQPTDDSEMALGLGRSIVAWGGYVPEAATAAYVAWLRSPAFDVGGTTRRALGAVTDGDLGAARAAAAAMTAASLESQANGSLMRIAPLGVWGASRSDDEVAAAARADAVLTHPHPVCVDAAEVFTVAIAAAIREGLSPQATWQRALARTRPGTAARDDLEAAGEAPPPDFLTHMGWVRIALRNAFHQLLRANDAEQGIVATVAAGGDTDTNGAIAGALLGAVHGRDAIPGRWRHPVLTCRPLDGTPTRHPRPRTYWPVDLLELAERLLLAGA